MSEAYPNGVPQQQPVPPGRPEQQPAAGPAYGQQPYAQQQPQYGQPQYGQQDHGQQAYQAGPHQQQGEPYAQQVRHEQVEYDQGRYEQQYAPPYEQPYAQPAQPPYAQQQQPAAEPAFGQQPYAQEQYPQQYPHQEVQQQVLQHPGQPLQQPLPHPFPAAPPAAAAVPPQPGAPAAGAPLRTGSPIIEPGLQPALITAGVAALLAGGAALGSVPLALTVVLLQVLTAAGWFRLNGMWPARQGIALAALAGFTADAAVLLAHGDAKAAAVVGTLGGFFLLVLVLQTFRPSDPAERFYALTVLGSATVVTVLCAALLVAAWVPAAMAAVALATVLAALPLPAPKAVAPVLGLLVAAAFGPLVGAPAALGALAGVGALVGRRVAAYDWPSRFVHMTAGVALPLAVASPLVWIGSRLLAG
ncbi:hypothetical protein J2S46_004555 [Kitasatospora herbaricolor]|uniref:hypothetical protein n=1 Tax=Kitasatospora herbaricolor TaxID=68217 RepID=UPI00174B52B5|nr:hypothetical protein [Kitasatospora herbaricolor]MDQ0309999.1 hypothetical protein [Kitasatospora herbaricolor]